MYALKIEDEHKRKIYMDYSKKWQSHNYRVNILKDAQVYHPISISEFDSDPYIFNCKNGTLDEASVLKLLIIEKKKKREEPVSKT